MVRWQRHALVAATALHACGANALVAYDCWVKGPDSDPVRVAFDIAKRYPAIVGQCRAVELPDPPADPVDTDEPVANAAAVASIRVIRAPRAQGAAPSGAVWPTAMVTPRWRHESLWPVIESAATRHSIDPHLVQAVIEVESAYAPNARSPKGALGLMQLMPATAARFGAPSSADLFTPAVNVETGVRYLRFLADKFSGQTELVLAAYNAGEGAVVRHGYKIPPFRETQDYVRKVLDRYPATR
ncbi:lytic transglycosylase domain-containing protein [Acidovorax sp. NCPPB 3576]|uniref:lytic transglycosylase domain-containing protein n=1 Tax=Acidovorax sp. NCPPB 3576 TaxID=2940488 RepID=UPI00234B26D0|nr:lytic transglycosylase domain-containing protein [Acidovorax sp. NCPPB 3576]WCM87878.1 lytic transglycosylase domain-containing protein [Acidovorax sp. NCPPB 3576]